MRTIIQTTNKKFPFEWANLDCYRESISFRKEIYFKQEDWDVNDLIYMFLSLFEDNLNHIIVFNKLWWDYCIDTWDFEKDEYSYDLEGKSTETQKYFRLLTKSNVPLSYFGCCICHEWAIFLKVILDCLISHKAPYSPIFYDEKNDYFFYFHETGSIGIYYKNQNPAIDKILAKSYEHYTVDN